MDRPSRDGASRDAWSSTIGSIDVHYSSGPMNRAFYFLSQGAGTTSGANNYSSYLPCGMTGIGNDQAARIAYRALEVYMTSNTNYAGARTAFLSAATDLYGASSTQYQAVVNAFAAINVGTSTACGGGGGGGGGTILNPGFESGAVSWTQSTGVISNSATNAHSGSYVAWMNGYGTTHTDTLSQAVTVGSTVTNYCFWLRITSAETTTTTVYDRLTAQINGTTLATYSNLNKSAYTQRCFNVSAYRGQSVTFSFTGTEDSSLQTSFFLDDFTLQ
jgi:thermolysin metallopeptidase-like protein